MDMFRVPLIIRGKIYDDCTVEFGGRKGQVCFSTPDVHTHFRDLVQCPMESLARFQELPIEEIARFLDELGRMFDMRTNKYMRQAFELSCHTSGLSSSILENLYSNVGRYMFARDSVMEYVDACIGADYLQGWVPRRMIDGTVCSIRALGARSVHVIAGNIPLVAFSTVMRGAVTRSDCIVKTPSNDPLTYAAVLQTMIELDPQHPVTRHMSAAYWKGGDESFESRIYHPDHVEKIVAWGGFDSIKHITRYLQPGLDLITLDPKHSASIVGKEALGDDETLRKVADRIACDVGAYNQELCANARLVYVECDSDDPEQLDKLNRLGKWVYESLQRLPRHLSTPSKYVDPALKEELDSLFLQDEWFRLYKGDNDISGAVVVSQMDDAVSFAAGLCCRTANLVPVKTLDEIVARINSSTQTVGVYPVQTKEALRTRLALRGAQMIVSLGYMPRMNANGPMDGMEPERRMLKWVVDQTQDESVPGPWVDISATVPA